MLRKGFSLLLMGATLLVAPVAVPPTAQSDANAFARNMGRGELVGKVVNTSNRVLKRRVQVRAGGREWTLHIPNGIPVMHGRQRFSVHDLDVGTYVRATGTRIGRTRLKAARVDVIGDRLALWTSGYGKRAGERGYFATAAGYRTRARTRR